MFTRLRDVIRPAIPAKLTSSQLGWGLNRPVRTVNLQFRGHHHGRSHQGTCRNRCVASSHVNRSMFNLVNCISCLAVWTALVCERPARRRRCNYYCAARSETKPRFVVCDRRWMTDAAASWRSWCDERRTLPQVGQLLEFPRVNVAKLSCSLSVRHIRRRFAYKGSSVINQYQHAHEWCWD